MSSKIELQLMLIDSDVDLLFLLKALLELTGCKVQTAKSYTEAFELIEAGTPDVIFTELFLNQLTILELSKKIRSMPRANDTLLVALTGHYYSGIAQDAWTAGFDRFLLKPVQFDQILVILRRVAKISRRNVGESVSLPKAAA